MAESSPLTPPAGTSIVVDIQPGDPLAAHLAEVAAPVLLADLDLDTPAVRRMRADGVHLLVPLVSSGELVGLVALGPPAHDDGYSRDSRQLLRELATRAAPALRVGQLVSRQSDLARSRERLDRELELARFVQHQFLPRSLPSLTDWQVAACYLPARVVGGDFYDVVPLPDGRLSVVVGDVTGKGVPAALVMSSVHSLLRAHAPRLRDPSELLAEVNDLLCRDIPEHMFVTCQVLVVDPDSGGVQVANAGHTLPLVRRSDGVVEEIRATGMPLGLVPGTDYDRYPAYLGPGDALLLHSDGVAEAHDPEQVMYGFDRLAELVGRGAVGQDLLDAVLAEVAAFTGDGAEQEDDITLVTLARVPDLASAASTSGTGREGGRDKVPDHDDPGVLLDSFASSSVAGSERGVMERVRDAVDGCGLDAAALDGLGTAVAETAMNAAEHGNGGSPQVPVAVAVWRTPTEVRVEITDHALTAERVDPDAPPPDIDLKLAGLESPRGWGLFLAREMVDAVDERTSAGLHTVRLRVRLPAAAGEYS